MIRFHREIKPAFGLMGIQNQSPVALYTVLSINEAVGDCAAYEGVGPDNPSDYLIQTIKAGGNKIREASAREIFPEIEEMGLRYRP